MKDILLIVTGLDNWTVLMRSAGKLMKKKGIEEVVVFNSKWRSDESWQAKKKRFEEEIVRYSKDYRVSLAGVSAGGLLSYYFLHKFPEKIHKVITFGGCNNPPKAEAVRKKWVRSFGSLSAFGEAVEDMAEGRGKIKPECLHDCVNYFAKFDEQVPREISVVLGAKNIDTGIVGHALSIGWAMAAKAEEVVDWVRAEKKRCSGDDRYVIVEK